MDTGERDQRIVERYRNGATLRSVGEEFGVSYERVRQIVRRADGATSSGTKRSKAKKNPSTERVRLRIGNLAKAVLVTGQAYQDPKDALNELVSNAADDYAQGERRGQRIRVVLRRKGRHPVVAVDDVGRGMSPDRLREVARNLFESTKASDDRTLGEKAIGLLGFQQLGDRCEIVSRAEGSAETWTLSLERGRADATLARERRRARQIPGTTVYLSHLDPEVLRMLTQRKVVEYLRRRRQTALARGDYVIEVVEGRSTELVTPEEPDGIKLNVAARPTLWGRIEFGLYVAPDASPRRRVAVVGRAGTAILDHLTEMEEFDHEPWTSGRVSGQIVFEALLQGAGRRAVLRDGSAFPVFRDAVCAIEPAVTRAVERVQHEVDEQTAGRLSDTVRRVFGLVLKELADLDNPMRTPLGTELGEGGLLTEPAAGVGHEDGSGGSYPDEGSGDRAATGSGGEPPAETPGVDELAGAEGARPTNQPAQPQPRRSRNLPSLLPDEHPGTARSRFDAELGVVLYNDRHADYLLVKDDEPALLDYLAALVAKEYVVYNNPLASAVELGEEMVRMLVRVRRHLPRRR